jgi:hypothetical protein
VTEAERRGGGACLRLRAACRQLERCALLILHAAAPVAERCRRGALMAGDDMSAGADGRN